MISRHGCRGGFAAGSRRAPTESVSRCPSTARDCGLGTHSHRHRKDAAGR